jgi:hypothetical protein
MPNSKTFYGIVGLAVLLFTVGFLSIFQAPASTGGQMREWQKTEITLMRQPTVMKSENRWDAEFNEGLEERPELDLSENFELVGSVGSDHSLALIRIKDPKNKSALDIRRIKEGGGLIEGVKVVHIETARVTIQSKDSQAVLTLYPRSKQENEQASEKKS